jgi:hypothetical protein
LVLSRAIAFKRARRPALCFTSMRLRLFFSTMLFFAI